MEQRQKKMLIVLIAAVSLVCVLFLVFRLAQNRAAEQLQQAEAEQQRQTEIEELVRQYFRPVGDLIATRPQLQPQFYAELPDGAAAQNPVIATVNGWPILLSDLAYRVREREIGLYEIAPDEYTSVDINETFELLVEDWLVLSQVQSRGLLPTAEQVKAFGQEKHADFRVDDYMQEMLLTMYDKLGVSEDEFWSVLQYADDLRVICFLNLWQDILEEAKELRLYNGEYYLQQKLLWKQQADYVQVTDWAFLQFTPDLQQLAQRAGML